jgi:hypothetical protein
MRHDNFAVFILTHGRADNVITSKTLKQCGYTGKVYYLVDDEDEQQSQYYKNFGDKVIVFSKEEMSERCDQGDLSTDRRTILYARNRCFDEAARLGLDSFLELDDDYKSFEYRYQEGQKLKVKKYADLDSLFDLMLDFLYCTDALTVALAQGGDFIGGVNGGLFKKGIARKAMNTFFCRTDKRFWFVGRINEDVNTYTTLGQTGQKIFTFTKAAIVQQTTQKNKGGMSDTYLDMGTYLKSFYSVMYSPSCVKISMMGDKHKRIHHEVDWDYCTPMILNQKYRKVISNG